MSPELTGPTDWDGIRAQALANSDWRKRYEQECAGNKSLLEMVQSLRKRAEDAESRLAGRYALAIRCERLERAGTEICDSFEGDPGDLIRQEEALKAMRELLGRGFSQAHCA